MTGSRASGPTDRMPTAPASEPRQARPIDAVQGDGLSGAERHGTTPSPEQLVDALEPSPRAAASATPPAKWIGKGVLIGVLIGALAIGAIFAALLARGGQ
jgi:hypothetical protein